MNVAEIKKELDRFEIPYEGDMNKPGLQALLDTELAKRSGGNDQDDDVDVDDLLGVDEEAVEPVGKQSQASLFACVSRMQKDARDQSEIKSEMAKLTARFQEEAKAILGGANPE